MSAQEVFEACAQHLFNQGRQSLSEDGQMCLYRSPTGLMCAAGIFITHYDPEMENKCWETLVDTGAVPDAHRALIEDLQSIHDSEFSWLDECSMKECFLVVAVRYGLNSAFLNDLTFGE